MTQDLKAKNDFLKVTLKIWYRYILLKFITNYIRGENVDPQTEVGEESKAY